MARTKPNPRALDLFCGGGGVSEGLLRAGFDVVGVDLDSRRAKAYNRGPGNPERHARPAVFVQADALEVLDQLARAQRGAFAPMFEESPLRGGFDFIWASPPCQAHSVLRRICPGKEYPDLIPATRERLIASGIPYCIENVPGAPLGGFLIQLCGTMFGLQTPDGRAELRRHRLFETSWPIALRPACQHGHVAMEAIGVTGTGNPTGSLNSHRKPESLTVTGTGMGPGNRGKEAAQRERKTLSVVGQKGLPGVSNARKVLGDAGGKAMSGGTMTPQGELKRRALAVAGNGARAWNGKAKVVTGAPPQRHEVHNVQRETFSTNDARAAMGISWMAMRDLSQAIPPAYAEWIARQALEMLVP